MCYQLLHKILDKLIVVGAQRELMRHPLQDFFFTIHSDLFYCSLLYGLLQPQMRKKQLVAITITC